MTESLSDRLKKNKKRQLKEELARREAELKSKRTPEEIARAEKLSQIRREAGSKGHSTQKILAIKEEARKEQERLREAYRREQALKNIDALIDEAMKIDPDQRKPWEDGFHIEVDAEEAVSEPSFEEAVRRAKEQKELEEVEVAEREIRIALGKVEKKDT